MSKTVAEHIAHILAAARLCQERAEQPLGGSAERWVRRHYSALSKFVREALPHGGGFDSGVSLHDDSTPERLVFNVPFHVMNDGGYYVGWAEYRVTVRPSFVGRITLGIEQTASCGNDAECGLEDLIGETTRDALTTEVCSIYHLYGEP